MEWEWKWNAIIEIEFNYYLISLYLLFEFYLIRIGWNNGLFNCLYIVYILLCK
jgi:hypothetical protein